ncbi:hypothetical protein [Amycolatopsis azurea]|uniref:hypothetical protein n=1 Tax=Amycolatopsis azurea TaxID=36819 RepID=UPI000346BAF0|nr:hypothetical protein [Amycolatopsis azurea]
MPVEVFALLGALGGSLRGLVDLYNQITQWHNARREHRAENAAGVPPKLTKYIDVVPEAIAGAVHIALGAAAGALFGGTGQVAGAYAAVVVGASAPALLTQLGQLRPIKNAVIGQEPPRVPDAS